MKKVYVYIFLFLVLFAIAFVNNKNDKRPKDYDWFPTYRNSDKNPFGGYVFDKMLEASWPDKYEHSYKNISRLMNEEKLSGQNILIVTDHFGTWEFEMNNLLDYVAKGHKILIASSGFDYSFQDSLQFSVASPDWYNYIFLIRSNIDTLKKKRDLSICLPGFEDKKYEFPALICDTYFDSIPKENARIIAVNDSSKVTAFSYPIGEGEIILSSTPLLFTNYGILSENNEFVWAILSSLQGKVLLRTEYHPESEEENRSPFRYLLSKRPLKWALYLTLISILLFMIFTAKRKQRVIPVVKEPENQMMKFVQSVAALYLRKSDNADILQKKYHIFAEHLLKDYHIDIINQPHDKQMFEKIAQKTGSDEDMVRSLFDGLNLIGSDFQISDKMLMDLVIKMDNILKNKQ